MRRSPNQEKAEKHSVRDQFVEEDGKYVCRKCSKTLTAHAIYYHRKSEECQRVSNRLQMAENNGTEGTVNLPAAPARRFEHLRVILDKVEGAIQGLATQVSTLQNEVSNCKVFLQQLTADTATPNPLVLPNPLLAIEDGASEEEDNIAKEGDEDINREEILTAPYPESNVSKNEDQVMGEEIIPDSLQIVSTPSTSKIILDIPMIHGSVLQKVDHALNESATSLPEDFNLIPTVGKCFDNNMASWKFPIKLTPLMQKQLKEIPTSGVMNIEDYKVSIFVPEKLLTENVEKVRVHKDKDDVTVTTPD